MVGNHRLALCLATLLLSAVPACSASDAGSAPGAVTGTGGASASGGGTSLGGAGGGASGGGGAGAGGSTVTFVDGSVGTGTTVDPSGTWIANVQTPGVLSVPTVGNVNANLGVVFRLVIAEAAGTANVRFDICRMTAVTTPDPKAITVTFTPAVIATMTTSASESAPAAQVGSLLPLPPLTILSGITATGASVDADADSHPGVTLPGMVGGQWPVNVYAGLTVPFSLSATLTGANSLSGTATFTATGTVFGSDSLWLTSGNIGVAPQPADVPFTAKLLLGDVPCADVLTAFP